MQRSQTPVGLTADEFAAAKEVLQSVNLLQAGLHSLEYLHRLPELIAAQEEKKAQVDAAINEVEQRLGMRRQELAETERMLVHQAAEVEVRVREIERLQVYLASEQAKLEQLRNAKELLREELREGLSLPQPTMAR